MKKLLTLIGALFALSSHAQHQETRDLNEFHAIVVSGAIDAQFIRSPQNSAEIRVNRADIAEKLETKVKNGVLYLQTKKNTQTNNGGQLAITVRGTLDIDQVKVSSASRLEITDPIQVKRFEANVASAGKLITSTVQAEQMEIKIASAGQVEAKPQVNILQATLSSSSKLTLSGKADQVKISATSASHATLPQLYANQAVIQAKSGATVTIQVENELTANASTGASIRYLGNPASPNIRESAGGRVGKR